MNLNNEDVFYKKNIDLLIKHYPTFESDILQKYSPSTELLPAEASDGLPTARIDSMWIHSSRRPANEATKLVRNGIKKKSGVCLVFGFGLGYHVEALMEEFPELDVLIIEPEPELFLKAMLLKDFSAVIESERTGFLLNTPTEALASVLSPYRGGNIQILKLRSVYERNIEYYERADEAVKAFIRKKDTNLNTLDRFGKTWIRNLFRNIEIFKTAADSGRWYSRFNNFPALVIAAGPSLDKLLSLLPELQKRFVIICVDTAVRAVMSAGVAPDFIVVVDPQYLNTRHLDSILDSSMLTGHTVLISESSTHPAVFRNCKLPVYFFKSLFPLGKMLERHAGISSELGAGGSVSTTAWDLAKRLGCPGIYTAGLDLGYPHLNTHCSISLSALYTGLIADRFKTVETVNFNSINNADPYYVENNSGGKTLTDKRLIIYKWWFEGQIKSAPGTGRFYNLSEHGVKIDGMEYRPSAELINFPIIRNLIEKIKSEVLQNVIPETKNDDFRMIINTIQTLIDECRRLETICTEALELLSGIEQLPEAKAASALAELSFYDQKISDSPSKELTGFIMQPVLNDIINNDNSVFENSEKLYSNLLAACEYHKAQAEKALLRF